MMFVFMIIEGFNLSENGFIDSNYKIYHFNDFI